MEEPKFVEDNDILPADKIKAASADGEIKESFSPKPSDQEEVFKEEQAIPSAEREPEPQLNVEKLLDKTVKKSQKNNDSFEENPRKSSITLKNDDANNEISPAAVSNLSKQEQELNETMPVETPNIEQNHIQSQTEELSPKENSTETTLKSQTQAEEQNGDKKSTAAQDETRNLKENQTIEDQVTTTTSQAVQEQETKDTKLNTFEAVKEQKESVDTKLNTLQAVQEKKMEPKDTQLDAAKKPFIKEARGITPAENFVESSRKDRAKDILLEQENRKTWKTLLDEVNQVSSLSAFNTLYEKSSPVRSAKQLYKKKMQILRDNFTYRLGLLKQLKEAIKDKYRSEAQQLYSDYTTSKHRNRYLDINNKHSSDSQESLVTAPGESLMDLDTLG
ncbi:enolase-phosphatase E1 [Drosophila kikkawai]|uniref:Enolase-phosphatase E1 n=1 Tax=Drosophila kikkawai TaxID=30033 RepID=A0A6P4IT76_DROKI|nr:microtubule-associated protein futsch [Drosophila kikkawai]